jgi:hypothetical protein
MDNETRLVRETAIPDTTLRRAAMTFVALFGFQAGVVCATAYVLRLLAA